MYTYNQIYFQYKKNYSYYLKELVKVLNNAHNKNFNEKYWEPLIGIYLRRFLMNYIFAEKNKILKKTNLSSIKFFRSYMDFSNNLDLKDYKFIFFKFNEILIKKNKKKFQINKINFFSKIKNFYKILLINLFSNLSFTNFFYSESYLKKNYRLKIWVKSFFNLYKFPNLNFENFKIDNEKILKNRLYIISKFITKKNKDLILNNLILRMPINYLENFNITYNQIKKINLCKKFYCDGDEVKFDYLKFYLSELKTNNKKIYIGQHSLRSGIQDYDSYFDYSLSISDKFLTWGWKTNLSKIRKYKSFRLASSLKKYQKIDHINNLPDKIGYILCGYAKIGECLYDNFFENKKAENGRINLLKKINNKKNLYLKPRSGSFINDNKKFYKKVKIMKNKKRLYDIFGKYNLLIFERMSLGIVESIYLNQPTILFYPKNLYVQKNLNYKKLLSLLKKANLYYDDPKKVTELVKSKKIINDWWLSKKNSYNRNKVLDFFAKYADYSDIEYLNKLN